MKLIAVNNIALLVICAFLLMSGYLVTNHEQAVLKDLRWKVKELVGRREVMAACLQEIEEMQRQQADSARAVYNKFIPAAESPDITFAYFDRLARYLGPSLNYRFKTSAQERKGSLHENKYTLEGTASFRDIYKFVHALENNRAYYRVYRLRLEQVWNPFTQQVPQSEEEKEIAFSAGISGYSLQGVSGEFLRASTDFTAKRPRYDLFSLPRFLIWELAQRGMADNALASRTHDELPRLLPEALLVAISGNIAHMRDNAGELVALREGDEVYEGKVTRIDLEEGSLEITSVENGEILIFRMSEAGIWGKR